MKIKNNTIYVVWCNTSSNKEIYNYNLIIKSLPIATLYKPEANDLLFTKTNIKLEGNGFKIDKITELPIFIQVN
jgi:hypothetical protein